MDIPPLRLPRHSLIELTNTSFRRMLSNLNDSGLMAGSRLHRFSLICGLAVFAFFLVDFIGVVFLGGIKSNSAQPIFVPRH
jgi:hypothetical protein